jgi:hypothetical protein
MEKEKTKNKEEKENYEPLIINYKNEKLMLYCKDCNQKTFKNFDSFLLHLKLLHFVELETIQDIINLEYFKTIKIERKKIIIGNTSKFIPEIQKEESDSYTHRWMIYIRGPKDETSLDYIVKKK